MSSPIHMHPLTQADIHRALIAASSIQLLLAAGRVAGLGLAWVEESYCLCAGRAGRIEEGAAPNRPFVLPFFSQTNLRLSYRRSTVLKFINKGVIGARAVAKLKGHCRPVPELQPTDRWGGTLTNTNTVSHTHKNACKHSHTETQARTHTDTSAHTSIVDLHI